ncbi:MAG: peptidoglycan DD-metalloendopeptidase family protein [Clostridiales bacterium]|nr:peptidoglycan DD-metalloendopeptidase family protein [Clostridiales bacterium]
MKIHLKRRGVRIVAASLAAVLTAALFLMTPAPSNYVNAENAQVQKYEDQIAELEQTQKELQRKISEVQSEASQTAEYKQDLDSLIYTLSQKISVSQALLDELEVRIEETRTSIAEKEVSIEETFAKFQERMRMSQEEGSVSYLSLLLGAESVSDFLSRVDRVNSILEYDKTVMDQYKTEKAELEAERDSLEASIALQQSTLDSMESDRATNEQLSQQAASYYDSLMEDQASYESQYAAAKAAEEQLDRELTAYLQSLQAQNSSQVTADGEFMWPLPVGQGYISCYYGDSDPNGSPHYAVDTAIAYGTPIYASNDGTILRSEFHSSYGYYILIDHGDGRSTLYAHCSSLAVSAGQTVAKGQVIGYVGSTGFSTGNHLHFEFRVNGNRTNPLNYVQAGV